MVRGSRFILPALVLITIASSARGQQLVGKGAIATQALVRNRQGISEKGDVVTVMVFQPAVDKGLTVSAHAEYSEGDGKWKPVPTPDNPFGKWYASAKYGGLRDLVDIKGTMQQTTRSVALFVPIVAFAPLEGKELNFRYVIRLWSNADPKTDKELSSLPLEPLRIRVGKDSDGIVVSVIDGIPPAGAPSRSEATPAADAHGTSVIRFFDTATGKWDHPAGSLVNLHPPR